MKQYQLTINKKPYTVRILEVHDDRVVAEVNGTEHVVGIDAIENVGLDPHAKASAQAGQVPPGTTGITGTSQTAQASAAAAAAAPAARSGADTGETIVTPMPGQIIALHVSRGDQVKKGQKLLILEAMKLENVITASVSGTVSEIMVAEGDVVAQGQILLLLS